MHVCKGRICPEPVDLQYFEGMPIERSSNYLGLQVNLHPLTHMTLLDHNIEWFFVDIILLHISKQKRHSCWVRISLQVIEPQLFVHITKYEGLQQHLNLLSALIPYKQFVAGSGSDILLVHTSNQNIQTLLGVIGPLVAA